MRSSSQPPRVDRAPVHAQQTAFFKRMGSASEQVREIFDSLPGFHFFLKDESGCLLAGSAQLLKHLGLSTEEQLIGRCDHDFYPKHMADQMREDDHLVMRTGQPLLNRMEIWYSDHQVLDWYLTNKHPVRDARGKVIGVMGIVRNYESECAPSVCGSRLKKAVDHIRSHLGEAVNIDQLAQVAGLSRRQLNRQFNDIFAMPAHEFLQRTRLQAATSAMTNSDKSLAQIAVDCGFCDQSALTQVFRKYVGETPAAYRRRYLAGRAQIPQ